MNYFAHQTAAERYAQSRPYFHPLVIDKLRAWLPGQKPLAQALDVACGTGQSTLALTAIAQQVIGADISAAMLAQAPSDPRICYLQASAEEIPLPAATIDLITVSLAFHWFDRARFLAEAQRLLRANAWLVIYNNGFSGQMQENPAFVQWNNESYLVRYPSPPRNQQPFRESDAARSHFWFGNRERYTNQIVFSVETLARYLMTQSNVIAAVEQGAESSEDVCEWLINAIKPLFVGETGTFLFGGEIWHLQKRE